MRAKALLWLFQHPMATVILALGLFVVVGSGSAIAFSGSSATSPNMPAVTQAGTAESPLPRPTQFPPRSRVEAAHRALHALGRACDNPISTRASESVLAPVAVMEQFARDYPNGGFTIDDEAGTTLSLVVVLRYELQNCEPSLVPSVEALLPARFRSPS